MLIINRIESLEQIGLKRHFSDLFPEMAMDTTYIERNEYSNDHKNKEVVNILTKEKSKLKKGLKPTKPSRFKLK